MRGVPNWTVPWGKPSFFPLAGLLGALDCDRNDRDVSFKGDAGRSPGLGMPTSGAGERVNRANIDSYASFGRTFDPFGDGSIRLAYTQVTARRTCPSLLASRRTTS